MSLVYAKVGSPPTMPDQVELPRSVGIRRRVSHRLCSRRTLWSEARREQTQHHASGTVVKSMARDPAHVHGIDAGVEQGASRVRASVAALTASEARPCRQVDLRLHPTTARVQRILRGARLGWLPLTARITVEARWLGIHLTCAQPNVWIGWTHAATQFRILCCTLLRIGRAGDEGAGPELAADRRGPAVLFPLHCTVGWLCSSHRALAEPRAHFRCLAATWIGQAFR